MNSNIIISFAFVILIFFFGGTTFRNTHNEIAQKLKLANMDTLPKITQEIENIHRTSFYEKVKFADLYGLAQAALNKTMIGKFEFIKDNQGFMHAFSDKKDVRKFSNDMITLKQLTNEKKIPLLYVQMPARELEGFTQMPIGGLTNDNLTMDEIIANLKTSQISYYDVRNDIVAGKLKNEDMFLKTDLHPTTEAEFGVAESLTNYMEKNYQLSFPNKTQIFDKNNYNVIEKDFLGNFSFSSGKYYTGLDKFRMYVPNFSTKYKLENTATGLKKEGDFNNVIMNGLENKPNNYLTYWITNYLQYPSPYYQIENELVENNNILVIMESNAMGCVSYLSLLTHNITIVDTRFQEKHNYILKALSEKKFDLVLVMQSVHLVDSGLFPNTLKNPQAKIISQNTPTEVNRKDTYIFDIKVKNTGNENWSETKMIRLSILQDGRDHGYRIHIPEGTEVKPGEEYTFILTGFRAPSGNTTYLEYQMAEDGVDFFGEKVRVDIKIE